MHFVGRLSRSQAEQVSGRAQNRNTVTQPRRPVPTSVVYHPTGRTLRWIHHPTSLQGPEAPRPGRGVRAAAHPAKTHTQNVLGQLSVGVEISPSIVSLMTNRM